MDEASLPKKEIAEVLKEHPHEAELLRPYWGGSELYDVVSFQDSGRLIAFTDYFGEECESRFPKLTQLVKNAVGTNEEWWLFARGARELYSRIAAYDSVLVRAETSNTWGFIWCNARHVFSNKCIVYLLPHSWNWFACLQSSNHEAWCRLTTSTLGDQLSYVPSDCFETFPFPEGFDRNPMLVTAGKEYYDFRAAIMVRNNEGLTKTYNRFHDPNETSPDILKLRELHAAMDRAVLDAYGWTDLKPTCEFLLDYEEEDEDENGGASKKKKPWRYRWPDDFRDEVLARLLELNKKRAEEEAIAGVAADATAKHSTKKGGGKTNAGARLPGME